MIAYARIYALLFLAYILPWSGIGLQAQHIHKFERISAVDGLSQNYVQSIYCDNKGFMWFGSWDGLNRYDGRQFKIFKVDPKLENSLTNNRIIDIWQDQQNMLWVKTNDGYIHYFVDETYEFITFPYYMKSLEERNSTITCFVESQNHEVLLGSSNSGMYYLTFDSATGRYNERQYLNRGKSTISNNRISFIITDERDDIWIGTQRGLNNISQTELAKTEPSFSNYWLDYEFLSAFRLDSIILFGTAKSGIKTYESHLKRFDTYPNLFQDISTKGITMISSSSPNIILVGTENDGLYIYDLEKSVFRSRLLPDKCIRKIYLDGFGQIWINTNEFGIYQLDADLKTLQRHNLTGEDIKSTVDDERQYIYEDSNNNLWIALHGGGLAQFNRQLNKFEFYRSQPNDNTTISSDNVYCITEDRSGMLWVGTGIPNGGVNKIYTSNEAFQQILLEDNEVTGKENIVRAILIDDNDHSWLGTKSGDIYILDTAYKQLRKLSKIPLTNGSMPGQNAYTMIQDKDGFIWIGTKGGGMLVTEKSLYDPTFSYLNLKFYHYEHDPNKANSLSSDLIYSIVQDSHDQIWIGTFEAGLNLVTKRDGALLECSTYNTSNSPISSDKIRNIAEDKQGRLWITSDFGINHIDFSEADSKDPVIHPSLFNPSFAHSLSYNDVIHVFQDSREDLWFGTSGGGINKLINDQSDSLRFSRLSTKDGLINDVVLAILEDQQGQLWFGTDHGISRFNPEDSTFENFDQSSNLATDVFNENTCAISSSGALLFGTNDGLLVIHPELIKKEQIMPNVVFTNFQLFNKDLDIRDPDSPIQQDIETLDRIDLNYFQSSFSIDYAALSFYAPTKNKYAFMLENFDENWNEVGNQNKATYTNLSPGEYTFKVKAANWNSDWSDKTRSIIISIHPPWWRTTIMYIVYFVVLVVVIELIRRSYVRYHKLQNDLKVEKRVSDIKLQFFTNISHEIRTPLTLILGPIHDIMELSNVPDSIIKKLHLVEKNGKRMLRLVNQLLDFRKVQKNKMALKVHKIELISFLDSIIENFNLVAQHKDVVIKFHPEVSALEAWVDPNKFDSVIFNILSNALKFSPRKSKVEIAISESIENQIEIMISDQGSGIPKNRINQIFERFSHLAEENEEFGSSGIGLAYSYQIVKLHHGDIAVSSELNKGSTFTISILKGNAHYSEEEIQHDEAKSLYQVKHDQVIEDEAEEAVMSTESKEKEHCLLIVEDNHQILNYLQENLNSEYKILTACDGQEALEVLKKDNPDIIITDLMMPVMNGIELTHKLKESLDTSHIPIIMLTAKSSLENQIEGIDSGAEAYILKPFNMSFVQAIISNLLKQRSIVKAKYINNQETGFSDLKITSKDEKFLNDITNYIKENYSDPEFNIERLVECCYVSRTVFYHKIKSLTGLTPIDFLRQKRLSIAAQMIVQSDYNISEIAYNTGFNDNKYFSKKFKELYGITPSQYKLKNSQTTLN